MSAEPQHAFDRMERMGHSTIQSGPMNNRIYLMRADARDLPDLPERLIRLAEERSYTKVFAKAPASWAEAFRTRGYIEEARVPGLFKGREDGVFMSRFLDPARGTDERADTAREVLETARARAGLPVAAPDDSTVLRELGPDDAEAMRAVYRTVFASYPFPIHDADYLRETMKTHVRYFGIEREGRLIALSSAERDLEASNAELTDFATLPEARGDGLALRLLLGMEAAPAVDGIRTFFTIARAYSFGMNITFARAGYAFGGCLVNNTQIGGRIESMNVWWKTAPSRGD